MMKKNHLLSVVLLLLVLPIFVTANNLENIEFNEIDYQQDYLKIQFDISWENSWRENGDGTEFSADNWDALWIFAKYSVSGGDWNHCSLALNGHEAPTESTIENPSANSDNRQTGVFIYRSSAGFGNIGWDDCKIKWNYGADGVADDANVDIKVFGIEMCFVPEGNFYLGDGGSPNSNSCFEGTDNNPVQISNDEVIVRMDGTYSAGGDVTLQSGVKVDGDGGICTTGTGVIDNANYPTGYKAFYCMKYGITQGQWVDFCNTITSAQASQLWFIESNSRHGTLGGSYPDFTTSRPDRNYNYYSVMDGMAYADWAGLRPMTELEFEKACRGNQNAIANEYAWGTNTICPDTSLTISGTEDGTETITTDVSNGACHYGCNELSGGDGGYGPLRAGIFAESTTDRKGSGATFYGIMEMSGNLEERPVTLGNLTGRGFTGSHGDGIITIDGYANIIDWPGYSSNKNSGATGSCRRGGSWDYDTPYTQCVSDRRFGAAVSASRIGYYGFRACRSK